ncbi:hypothetical protein Q5705_09575 [Kosakonia sp. H02]|nr:hypothetical protein Q5705_09575 [Kosakonia sp. H02]
MLSLFPHNVQCEIHPRRLVLRRRGQVIAEQTLTDDIALEAALDQLLNQHGRAIPWWGKLSFWLANSQVYYFTVPWQAGISRPEELRSFAATFAATQPFGQSVSAFRTAFISAPYGTTALVAAIDEQLWQTLLQVARKWKLRVGGIYVELHNQLRPWQRKLPADVLFCLRGAQSSIFASRRHGQWQQVWSLNNENGMDENQHLALVARLMGMDSHIPRYFLNSNGYSKG